MKPRFKARPPSKVFHAITHVWGHQYLDLFLNVCIPNQLAPGNIPALPSGSRYRILTRAIHVEELDAHPNVRALRDVIPVDIVVVELLDRQMGLADGNDLMIACHEQAFAEAVEADAAMIMLSADFVFSDQALAAVVRRHSEGYRAVVNTGLRLAKEPFVQHLAESRAPLAALAPRRLVAMALPYLHPYTEALFADASRFMIEPWAVYWRVGAEGLLARCMSLHPLMVDAVFDRSLKGANDGRFLSRVCPDFSQVHVVTDSDELQMFELTSLKRKAGPGVGGGASKWRCALTAGDRDDLQLSYWQTRDICLHTGDLDGRWTATASIARAFAAQVMRRRRFAKIVFRSIRRVRRLRTGRVVHQNRPLRPAERLQRWGARQAKAWKRRRPELALKRISRSLRLATHRSAKRLRKSTQHVLRYVGAR
jgi:hypothetical protein